MATDPNVAATWTQDPTGALPTAADVMNPSPRTCSPYSTVLEVVLIFKDVDCGMVPIVDDGKPIGVVTDRDIALALAEHPDLARRPASEIMSSSLVAVPLDTPIDVVVQKLANEGIRRLLVLDDGGLLAGIIAWADLAPHLPPRLTGQMVADNVEQP